MSAMCATWPIPICNYLWKAGEEPPKESEVVSRRSITAT